MQRSQSKKVERQHFVINFVTPDSGEKFVVELSNATLTSIEGFQAAKPDLTPAASPFKQESSAVRTITD